MLSMLGSQTVVVTGAGGFVGSCVIAALLQHGVQSVVATDVTFPGVASPTAGAGDGPVRSVVADVSKDADVDRVFQSAGPVAAVIHIAAAGMSGPAQLRQQMCV